MNKKHTFLAVFVSFVAVVLLGLPIAAKYVAIDQLDQLGAKQVVIDDVDINLFAGSVAVKGLRLVDERDHAVTLKKAKVNASIISLFSQEILVEKVLIDGLEVDLRKEGEKLWFGLPIDLAASEDAEPEPEQTATEEEEGGFDWGIGLSKAEIKNSSVKFTEGEFVQNLKLNSLKVEDVYSWLPDNGAALTAALSIEENPLTLNAVMTPFAKDIKVNLDVTADRLAFSPYQSFVNEMLSDLSGNLSLKQSISLLVKSAGGMDVSSDGSLSINDVSFVNVDESIPLDSLKDFDLNWAGAVTVAMDAENNIPMLTVAGKLVNEALALGLAEPEVQVNHEGITWEGKVELADMNIEEALKVQAGLLLENLMVTNTDNSWTLVSLPSAKIESLELAGLNNISWSSIELADLAVADQSAMTGQEAVETEQAAGQEVAQVDAEATASDSAAPAAGEKTEPAIPPLVSQGTITVGESTIKNLNDVNVAKLEISDLQGGMLIAKGGSTPQLDALTAGLGGETAEPEASASETAAVEEAKADEADAGEETAAPELGVKVLISQILISGESRFLFEDNSVVPAFKRQMDIKSFQLDHVELSNDPGDMTVDIVLGMDDQSEVVINGVVTPLINKVDAALVVDINNVQLTPLSSYMAESTGYKIKTGKLDFDADVKVVQNQLDVTDEIVLNNIELTPDNKEKLDKLAKELTMPLDYALNIIRDGDNNVVLKVPVTGDLNNPDFSVNDIFKVAMKKALKVATVHYLKNMLAPYGTAISLAQTVGGYLTKITMDPVYFPPTSSELTSEMQEYLTTLNGNLLEPKPQLRVKLCGYSAQTEFVPEQAAGQAVEGQQVAESQEVAATSEEEKSDKEISELDQQLMALAKERSANIKTFLVGLGVQHERLFECSPEIDIAEKAQPRVELSI